MIKDPKIYFVLVLCLKNTEYFFHEVESKVFLTSKPSEKFPNNTKSKFTVLLPNTMFLNENWRVSVATINIPNRFSTFPEEAFLPLANPSGNRTNRNRSINEK